LSTVEVNERKRWLLKVSALVRRIVGEHLMTEQELAAYCRVSVRTVQRWRQRRTGPPVLWAGDKPRYRKAEVDAWLRCRAEK
jgi:predicted DNA-binding transcriptional regulator YafY